MKELSDLAIDLLDDMLTEWSNHDNHYPDENTDVGRAAHAEVSGIVRAEAMRRKLWWTQ